MNATEQTLEELFIVCTEHGGEASLSALKNKLKDLDSLNAEEMTSHIGLMLESWGASAGDSEAKAEFCIFLAEHGAADSQQFRNALNDAVRKLLPPYLGRTGFVRALGLRDAALTLSEFSIRYRTLCKLKKGVYFFIPDSRGWGKVVDLDEFAPSVAVSTVSASSSFAVPMPLFLSSAKLFEPNLDTQRLSCSDRRESLPSQAWRAELRKKALSSLSEEEIKGIALHTLVPSVMSSQRFEEWWVQNGEVVSSESVASSSPGAPRRPSAARSIHELYTLLESSGDSFLLTASEAEKFAALFKTLAVRSTPKDNLMLAEAISMIAARAESGQALVTALSPLAEKCPFWPSVPASIPLHLLDVCGKLSAKHMVNFVRASSLLFPPEYLAALAVRLPLKCLSSLCESIDQEILFEEIYGAKTCSSDILVWVWKNRSKCSEHLASVLTLNNVVCALSQSELPKEWASAQRELKKFLMDNESFRTCLVGNAKGNISSIVHALQKAKFFQPGEQQSFLVKLARVSPELREAFEKGEGKKLLGSGGDTGEANLPAQPVVTSIRSYKQLAKELDDIIRIHTPENTAAIAHARGFGDFRENAEYDAAKERRRFLQRRRAELESLVGTVQMIDFRGIKPEGSAILGSTVKLTLPSGELKEFHLLGAWDGDPDNHCISYRTKLGEVLLYSKPGDSLSFPDGTPATVKEICPLPAALATKLADEK
ncbi:MAG: hypothetical protein A2X49_10885 [Lentisphaerae bacterium GWF2_52_8]|nr:MAG: hypothetical protein A2X49_10885 [Lentisphaerae bacterium GWF2_52_8]